MSDLSDLFRYNLVMPWWNLRSLHSINPSTIFLPVVVPTLIWSLIWKGIALYKSARNEQKKWFVLLLITNTLGILPIIYLLFFSTPKKKSTKKK